MVNELRAAGHDVRAVVEGQPGVTDAEVLALARVERRVLLTNDKDFAELVFGRRLTSFGIVLLRLRGWNAQEKATRLMEVLAQGPALRRALLVVMPPNVRRRALPDPD